MPTLMVGPIAVHVWQSGYPVQVEITINGATGKIDHRDLRHLRYAVDQAIAMAREELPPQNKHEVG